MEMIQYKVRKGNTLFGIAQFFQTSIEDILKYNNLQNPSQIYIGQTLTIPAGSQPVELYVTRPGDTLWSIAQKTNQTVDQLMDLNGIGNPNIIYPGQVIRIG